MRKPTSRKFKTKLSYSVAMACFLVPILMLFLSLPASVGGGTLETTRAEFRAMQTDLRACMEPGLNAQSLRMDFSNKYKVSPGTLDQLASANVNSAPIWHIICSIELETLPGALIWRIRADKDGWNYECGRQDVDEYCYRYSDVCNHWWWTKGCLESKTGPYCFKH